MGAVDPFASATKLLAEDRTPIRFAHLLAREMGGFTKPAGYDPS